VTPRRGPGFLLLSLATALTLLVASPARAGEAPSSTPPAVAAETSPLLPLARVDGAGWIAASAPAPLAPPVAAHIPIARRWWFWASLGAAAVAVVIAGFALAPGQPYSGNAFPGVVPLP
jgi:hypothetical protein